MNSRPTEPQTRYARSAGLRIAYQVTGSGPGRRAAHSWRLRWPKPGPKLR
jgi:hypothetical protein